MALRMPAEWEPHERCLLGWPGDELVSTRLVSAAKVDYGLVARAVAVLEPLLVVARPGFGAEAAAHCGPDVEVVELDFGAAWFRDSAPLFARRDDGGLVAVDFLFDGWGDGDRGGKLVGEELAPFLDVEHAVVPLVLEGGSVSVDGEGTLLAVEPTVLDPARNPGATRAAFEDVFREHLGVETTIWLPHGLLEDRTGGHVDNVAAFVAPGRVLCQTVRDSADPNRPRLAANRAVLAEAVDVRGRRLEVVELDLLPYFQWAGRRVAAPYLNFYVANDGVVVPLARVASDAPALALFTTLFPGRRVVGVPATNLARRGGGPHCITQQLPRR